MTLYSYDHHPLAKLLFPWFHLFPFGGSKFIFFFYLGMQWMDAISIKCSSATIISFVLLMPCVSEYMYRPSVCICVLSLTYAHARFLVLFL